MPRVRSRGENCPYCGWRREVLVNLDTQQPMNAKLPQGCKYGRKCIEEVRDKALLAPFEDGKMRRR